MKDSVYKSVKGSVLDRPDLTIFLMRSVLFGLLWLFAEALFIAKIGHMPAWKWFLFFNIRIILLLTLFYNAMWWLRFKLLKYILSGDTLKIVLFPNKIVIRFSEIKTLHQIKEPLNSLNKGSKRAYA